MGIHIEDTAKLGNGFHRRASALSVGRLFELAELLDIDTHAAPEADLYDWLRQRIYDELQAVG